MSREGLEALRARVHADPALATRLCGAAPEHFAEHVLRFARDAGIDVTADDLTAACAQARRRWLLRWIR